MLHDKFTRLQLFRSTPRVSYYIALIALLVVGCASPQPIVSPKAQIDTSTGYVAGMFSGHADGIGLGLVNRATNKEYLMPFFKPSLLYSGAEEVVSMIRVPPGFYRVAYWTTYSSVGNEVFTKTDFQDRGDKFDLIVGKGRVAFIGRYSAHVATSMPTGQYGYKTTEFELKPQTLRESDLIEAFKKGYPNVPITLLDY
jgi:hypothetical protein